MSKDSKNKTVPFLRFNEFRDKGNWIVKHLGSLSKIITERAGTNSYTLMSVTAGIGLVSQIEKFGREIAGEAYRNYIVIQKGDFAYNKSSTKQHPEGQIALLENIDFGAVPNSIFTCFRVDEKTILPSFLKYPFANNIHGNWLRNFIAVGSRANGALNVDTKDLLSLPIAYPSIEEQQKIASCLSSIDDLISAQSQKLDALKAHKKGLMQQLFPAEGETVPKLRFKEFEDSGEWEENVLGNKDISIFVKEKKALIELEINTYISTENLLPDFAGIIRASKLPSSGSFTYYKSGDILLSNIRPYLKKIWVSNIDGAASNDVIVVRPGNKISGLFLSFLLKNDNFINYVMKGAQGVKMPRGDKSLIEDYPILFPSKQEQQKIASCLSSFDDLITAQSQKLEALKAHKKGLMQQLFPSINESEA